MQATPGSMEFKDGVSAGQSVMVQGSSGHDATSKVIVDDPAVFKAAVALDAASEVDFQGLSATSYTYQDNVLTLYSGDQPSYTLNLSEVPQPGQQPVTQLQVATTTNGVAVDYAPAQPTGYTPLPVYSSPAQPPPSPPTPPSTPPSTPPQDNSGNGSSTSGGTVNTTSQSTTMTSVSSPAGSNTTTNVVVNSTPTSTGGASSSSSNTSNAAPVVTIPNGGNTPTPLSPAEVSTQQVVVGLNAHAGAASTFFFDGGHLGTDFDNLGAVLSNGQDATAAMNQTLTDMKQLLSAWVADPAIATGFSVPGGPTMAIPGQFVADVINAGLKADVIGSAPLDQAYGGALTQFFAGAQQVMMGVGHQNV